VHFCVLYGSQDREPIISLQAYNIDWLVFVPETEFIYWAVRAGLNSVQANLQHVEHNVKCCAVKG